MPTTIPTIARQRRISVFLLALILLYAACALAMIDGFMRQSTQTTEAVTEQIDAGL